MDPTALKSTLAALLLLSAASISVQQSAIPGANPSIPGLKSPNQGPVSENHGLPASQEVPSSPPPPLGGSSLLATPPPSPLADNSLRSPPPQLPVQSSGHMPGVPAPGSTPPPPIQIPKEPPRGDEKEKDGSGGILIAGDDEVRRCDKKDAKCGNNLVFCLLDPPKDLKKHLLVVHNQGKIPLNVSIVNSTSSEVIASTTLGSDESKKIELAADTALNYEIRLDNGKPGCPLLAVPPPPPSLSMFQQLPAYASRLSPVYAAYGMLFTALLAGGTCAWCRFRRRARHVDARIPYQQLEMGTQTHPSYARDTSNTVNTAQGWDQGWDDDWDDEEAAAGPPHGVAATSSNGAAKTKSSTKDGWEDWDD